jgi:hypothetical protein
MRTLAFVLALSVAPAAFAQTNTVSNNQLNNTTISAHNSTTVHDLRGPLSAASVAGGNSVGVDVSGNVAFHNTQRFFGNARAVTDVNIGGLGGEGLVLATAFSNNAELNAATACCVSVNNLQIANIDPTAITNVTINAAAAPITVQASAFSNGLSVNGSGWGNMGVNNTQLNGAATHAVASVGVNTLNGSLSTRASAIGNSLTVNNIPRN